MSSYAGYGTGGAGVGTGAAGMPSDGGRERGSRRKKIAAMAGRVYSAGATAVNELRESYNQTRVRPFDTPELAKMTIPGSFPEVAIVTKGNEQMVLFPSYAKKHVRQRPAARPATSRSQAPSSVGISEEDYWRQEWARHEDERAIVDVDVRGWVYNPHKGAMTRRNRILIGLARQLSGIPIPQSAVAVQDPEHPGPSLSAMHEQHEEEREQMRIAQEAREIERKGQGEKEAAQKGEFSEPPKRYDDEDDAHYRGHVRRTSQPVSPIGSAPGSPVLGFHRVNTSAPAELTEAELAVANANLMARLGPFLTTPLVQLPITVFFYNDETSQSRTVATNDAGHFIMRAALDFVPTHVRVLANEDLSATEPVEIIESKGISLISDIDDTIKHSNISVGAREIFRNTFIRDLNDLTVEGVKEWYGQLHELGVRLHYCSNSPWQLFPVIASFFKLADLPPGSIHLKQYSGMLQGIFEPVAERKKGTLEKIMRDFPERKFLLVGDSGEADLEVYTEIALAHPGRVVAIFIRDVTTPEVPGFFDAAFSTPGARITDMIPNMRLEDDLSRRPALPARTKTEPPPKAGSPLMGDLIDLSEEPEAIDIGEPERPFEQAQPSLPKRAVDLLSRKVPPPRPAKPTALQSSPMARSGEEGEHKLKTGAAHPLAQMQNSSDQTLTGSRQSLPRETSNSEKRQPESSANSIQTQQQQQQQQQQPSTTRPAAPAPAPAPAAAPVPIPPPPRRRLTPTSSILTLSPRLLAAKRRSTANSDVADFDPLPGSSFGATSPTGSLSGRTTPSYMGGGGSPIQGPVNKKLDLWRRRLDRAQDTLDREGVALYTWRRGDDVVAEAVGLVKGQLQKMGLRGHQ